jgi:hypothetical protein
MSFEQQRWRHKFQPPTPVPLASAARTAGMTEVLQPEEAVPAGRTCEEASHFWGDRFHPLAPLGARRCIGDRALGGLARDRRPG